MATKREEEQKEEHLRVARRMSDEMISVRAENLLLKQILEQKLKIELIPKYKCGFA